MSNTREYIILNDFLNSKKIEFKSERSKMNWVKKTISPKTLIKIGSSFFVEKDEMERLFLNHLIQKTRNRKSQIENGKNLAKINQQKTEHSNSEDQTTGKSEYLN